MFKNKLKIIFFYFYFTHCLSLSYSQDLISNSNLIFPQDELTRINIFLNQNSLDSLINVNIYNSSEILYNASIQYISSFIDTTIYDVGVRLRGNSSLTAPKKSFKLDFNAFLSEQKFLGVEKLNLNANQNDPSLLRAALSWKIIRDMNIPGTRTSFTKLYINDDFMGVYVVTEHIDEEFIKNNYEKDYGNLYKCLWPAPLYYLGEDPDAYKIQLNGRRSYDLKTNKFEDNYSDLSNFIAVLNNSSDEDFVCEIERVFNVADYLKILALDVLIGNWDGYTGNKNNYYLYYNPSTHLFDYIPYDLDNTWGIDWIGQDWAIESPYNWAANTNFGTDFRPLYDRILAVDEYRNLYTYYLTEIISNWFNQEYILEFISSRQNLLSQAIIEDMYYPLSFGFTQEDFQNSLIDAWGEHVEYGFIDWLETRIESINSQLENHIPVLVVNELSDNSPVLDTLKIKTKVYSLDNFQVAVLLDVGNGSETISMFDDGLHSDEEVNDGVWGVEIPILSGWISVDYRIIVTTDNSPKIIPCEPVSATVGVTSSDLLINELMSLNSSVVLDNFFEFDDWCELYNSGFNSIELNQFYLTDNISRPDKYLLPQVIVESGGHTFYWLDKDPEQGENHATFKLSSEGEELALFQKGLNHWYLIDYISFGSIQEDESYGRIADGAPQWHFFETPTPNSSNNIVEVIENDNIFLKIWPNPTVNGGINFSDIRSGSVYDLIGNKILDFKDTYYVDIDTAPKGLYMLKTIRGEVVILITK